MIQWKSYCRRSDNGEPFCFKVDGKRFEGTAQVNSAETIMRTYKFNLDTLYKISIKTSPPVEFQWVPLYITRSLLPDNIHMPFRIPQFAWKSLLFRKIWWWPAVSNECCWMATYIWICSSIAISNYALPLKPEGTDRGVYTAEWHTSQLDVTPKGKRDYLNINVQVTFLFFGHNASVQNSKLKISIHRS